MGGTCLFSSFQERERQRVGRAACIIRYICRSDGGCGCKAYQGAKKEQGLRNGAQVFGIEPRVPQFGATGLPIMCVDRLIRGFLSNALVSCLLGQPVLERITHCQRGSPGTLWNLRMFFDAATKLRAKLPDKRRVVVPCDRKSVDPPLALDAGLLLFHRIAHSALPG
jgi:hypothetical protein